MADDMSGFSLVELFRLEAEGQTATLAAGVLAIEQLDASPQTLESMMRAAHSLKGAARIVGLEPAVQVAHALEDRPAAQRRHAGTHLGRLVGAGVRNVRKPAVALKRGHRAHRGRERRHCEDGGKEQWRVVEFCRRHHRFRTTARTTARTHPPRRWPRAPARRNKPSWHRCSGRGAGATDIHAGASRRTRIAEGEDSRHQAPSLRAKPRKRRNQRPHCARAAFR
jgi:chemotaxis protein histidine kinase CheA